MVSSGTPKPKSRLATWWESLTPLSRALAIALAAPLTVLNAWAFSSIFGYFQSMLVILIVASLAAFLLNYPVAWLQRRGMQRTQAAIVVFLMALVGVLVLAVTLLPLAIAQAQQLVARLPEWFDSGQRQLMMLDQRFTDMGLPISLDGIILQINDRLKGQLQTIAGRAVNLTLDLAVFTVAKVIDVLLTVISTFYLLQHGDEVWDNLIGWLPIRIQQPFSKTLRLSFQNYFLGQIISSTCMAVGLISAFLFLKVPFGLLFGLTIGLMALVPFGGSVGIALVTFLVGLRDIGTAAQVLAVSAIVQQIVENGIVPGFLGSITGLNPFWVFVSILTGARVGGLLGIVVAVPTAVMVKEALEAVRSTRKAIDATANSEIAHHSPIAPETAVSSAEPKVEAAKEKVPEEV
ncbi:MAG: AI-2E family transporter [Leptolyngbyaceae cyanobacterium]|uniref:AI-2E family transporter n=2 Tax=Leptodesmis TaxID=2664261 RepID=UPI001F39B2E2|nr:AI-2E family transporter [Leptodesmis sichuanensis]UIE36325.1 AI-2E family transporter [Leptodesmis sichuanensis A121]